LFANRIASAGTNLHFLVLRLIRVAKLGAEREAECREEGLGPSSAFAPSLSRTGIDRIDTRASLTPGRRSGEDFGAEFTPELREQEQRIREQAAARQK